MDDCMMYGYMNEYVERIYKKTRTIMKVVSDIGMSLVRRCRGALECDGKHDVVCQLLPLTKLIDGYETRYKNNEAVMDGVIIWRTIIDGVLGGSDCTMPYLNFYRYKTRNGGVVKLKNIHLTNADDLHIVVSFDVETIKEA